jgi:hypothetical protein
MTANARQPSVQAPNAGSSWSIGQFAATLGLPLSVVVQLIDLNTLPSVAVGGAWMISPDAASEWLDGSISPAEVRVLNDASRIVPSAND